MAERVRDFGMDRVLSGKPHEPIFTAEPPPINGSDFERRYKWISMLEIIAAKYDAGTEAQIRNWFKQLINEDIGEGRHNVEKSLRNGILLCKLVQHIYNGTPNLPPSAASFKIKPNTMTAPFKQMENVEIFLKACEHYGVPRTSLFQVVDLYEGRNMAAVMSCLLQLGSECQRNGFQGPVVGPKPSEKHRVEFTADQLRAGQTIIGLQAGSNKGASQSGMNIGGSRHIADIKIEKGCAEGDAIIGLQAGSNKGASQTGMSMGAVRHIADLKVDDMSKDSEAVIGLQSGSNRGASQTGMRIGSVRHASDIKCEGPSSQGCAIIGLQMGTNQLASQSGMVIGGVRHANDLKVDRHVGDNIIGLQMGSNQGASQAGMSLGAPRHIDMGVDAGTIEGQNIIGLQMGTNRGATQSGIRFGGQRHVTDM